VTDPRHGGWPVLPSPPNTRSWERASADRNRHRAGMPDGVIARRLRSGGCWMRDAAPSSRRDERHGTEFATHDRRLGLARMPRMPHRGHAEWLPRGSLANVSPPVGLACVPDRMTSINPRSRPLPLRRDAAGQHSAVWVSRLVVIAVASRVFSILLVALAGSIGRPEWPLLTPDHGPFVAWDGQWYLSIAFGVLGGWAGRRARRSSWWPS